MNATQYLNSPVKNCATCVHRVSDDVLSKDERFDHCRRHQMYCATAVQVAWRCGKELREWRAMPPKPLRRSLRQWLYDLLLK